MSNNSDDENRKKQKEEQISKDRFISMSAKGHSKDDIILRLNLTEEIFLKWSRELKDKVLLKHDEISKAKKVAKTKKLNTKIKYFRKPLLALIGIFAVFSFTAGTIDILKKNKFDTMSRCLSTQAQLNFITGQNISLFPGGPVNREHTVKTAQNREALSEILITCEKEGYTSEDSFTSALLNTRQGKGDRVVDMAGILSASDRKSIERKLIELEQSKGSQIVVVTTYSVQPLTIELFANQLFNTWKIGRKNIDDGVLFLIAKEDRKMRIEVGYGLEGAISDLTAKSILRDYVRPYFTAGRMSEGIKSGVDKIIAQIYNENLPKPEVEPSIIRFLDIKYFGPFCGITAIVFLFISAIILNYKGVLIILAMMVPGIFNYFFNTRIFHELAAINFILIISFIVLYWKIITFAGRGSSGGNMNVNSGYDEYLHQVNVNSYSDSGSGGSGSSDSGFSGGGGESGGGGASDSW